MLDNFIASCLDTCEHGRQSTSEEIWQAWCAWCIEAGVKIGARDSLLDQLRLSSLRTKQSVAQETPTSAKRRVVERIRLELGKQHPLFYTTGEIDRVEIWDILPAPKGVTVITRSHGIAPIAVAAQDRDAILRGWSAVSEV